MVTTNERNQAADPNDMTDANHDLIERIRIANADFPEAEALPALANRRSVKVLARGRRARSSRGHKSAAHDWDELSLDALFARFDLERRRHGAPPSTYDALLFELRTHGLPNLKQPNCRRRLADLSTAQVRELIATMIQLRAKNPTITDALISTLGDQLP
jgi:hypothetical protein